MGRRFRRFLALFLVACLISGIFTEIHCLADSPNIITESTKDVTKTMKKNKKFCTLVRDISNYTSVQMTESSSKKTVNIKLNNTMKYMITASINYQYYNKTSYTATQLKSDCKDIFGNAGALKDLKKNDYIKKQGSKYRYIGGEWGVSGPNCLITKVTKISKNIYDVYITNKIIMYDNNETFTIGTSKLRIKKSSIIGKYGYIVTAVQYKSNAIFA